MTKRRVMIVGGGLAGLAAAMKLAELDCDVEHDEPRARETLA